MRNLIGAMAAGALLAACSSSGNGTVNGCADADFVDRTGAGTSRVVSFGGQGGSGSFSYEPMCVLVAESQTVTFEGAFGTHPLRPGIAAGESGSSSANNPIPSTSSGTAIDVLFPAAGTYPFFCNVHHGIGMFGAVKVQ